MRVTARVITVTVWSWCADVCWHVQIVFVSKYAALGLQPSRETRNMLAIAYKTVVGRLRSALQVLMHSSHPDEEVQEELASMRAQVRAVRSSHGAQRRHARADTAPCCVL